MSLTVKVERSGDKHSVEFSGTVKELLEQLSINPQTVLVVRDGELLTEDVKVSSSEEIDLLSVISGG